MFHFQYSAWWIIPCLLLGAVFAFLLYRRDQSFEERFLFLKKIKYLLLTLRGLSVFLIALLLLVPLFEHLKSETKKPIVCLLMDNSRSMRFNNDTTLLKNNWEALKTALEKDFEVKSYLFGNQTIGGNFGAFEQSSTNMAAAITESEERNAGASLAGTVICSDGIYNTGNNPLFIDRINQTPIYTIAVGDTTLRPDLFWKEINVNKTCFLNDQLSFKAEWKALQLAGKSSTYFLYEKVGNSWQKLLTGTLSINGRTSGAGIQGILTPKDKGLHQYKLCLDTIPLEINKSNNQKSFFVEVIEKKRHISIIADAPHPDLAALKNAISEQIGTEVEIIFAANYDAQKVGSNDLVILHGLPSRRNPATSLLQQIQKNSIPCFYIVSSTSNLVALNNAQSILNIRPGGSSANEVQAKYNTNFNHFNVEESTINSLNNYPPLLVPFADFKINGDVQVIAQQKIGNTVSSYPLLVLGNKEGILCGEGVWRWAMQDNRPENSYGKGFSNLINKITVYLQNRATKQAFEVNPIKKVFASDESVSFEALLRNENGEYINAADVNLTILDANGKSFNYIMNKETDNYSLSAGILPSGVYTYKGKCQRNGKDYLSEGVFRVDNTEIELQDLVANHTMLRTLANKNQGITTSINEYKKIIEHIKQQASSKPRIINERKTEPFIQLVWVLLLIVLLLGIEWVLRKFYGTY